MAMPTQINPTQLHRMELARLVTESQLEQAKALVNAAFPQETGRMAMMGAVVQALATNYLAETRRASGG